MIFFKRNIALFFSLIILSLFNPQQGFAQDQTYHLKKSLDIPLLSVGTAGTVASLLLRNRNTPLSIDRINQLDENSIAAFDFGATKNYSEKAQLASDIILTASYALPLSALIFQEARQNLGAISVMLLESILINETLTGLTKNLVKRPRPFTYNRSLSNDIRTQENNNLSFFSGHTSYTAMFTFFSASVLSNYVNNRATKAAIWTGAAILPAATAYFRYKGGKHYISDVVTGYIVGAAVGFIVPMIHRKAPPESTTTLSNGIRLDQVASQPFSLVFVF